MHDVSADVPAGQGRLRVLLVEDNAGFAYYVHDILVRQYQGRFETLEARTLSSALELLKNEPVDVVLLDLGLPDSVRYETFERVKAAAGDVPIIILTVLDDDEVALKAMSEGAQDYLVKDQANSGLLVRSIHYAVERVRTGRALHALSGRLLQLQDEERRRIARALHDTTAQNLAALGMNMSLLRRMAPEMPPVARALLEESAGFLDQCSAELRTVSYLLHPPLLDELGLAGAVRDYADGFAERSGIRVDLELPPALDRLAKDVETALFRVMQECLSNVHRHSGSPSASIRIELRDPEIVLSVEDRGRGIAAGVLSNAERGASGLGVGIAGMRERLRQLGGRLSVQSSDAGTLVTAALPARGARA